MATLAATGAIGLAAGSIDMDHPLFAVSLTLFLVAMSVFIALRTGATTAVIEQARREGYARGYTEGREVARPVVVPISRSAVENSARVGAGSPSSTRGLSPTVTAS